MFRCLSGYWFYRDVFTLASTCQADGHWTQLERRTCTCKNCFHATYTHIFIHCKGRLTYSLSLHSCNSSSVDIFRHFTPWVKKKVDKFLLWLCQTLTDFYKFFHWHTSQKISKIPTHRQHMVTWTFHYVKYYEISENYGVCAPVQSCLAYMWIRQNPGAWQAETAILHKKPISIFIIKVVHEVQETKQKKEKKVQKGAKC